MNEREVAYLERRAAAEAEAALRAACQSSAKAHSEIAKAYRASAEALRGNFTG